jgi:hypothetical protein
MDFWHFYLVACSIKLVSITEMVNVASDGESYLADTATDGRFVLVTCGRSIIHLTLALDARGGKFCLLDGLLTLGAHHDRSGCSYVSKIVSTDGGRKLAESRRWMMAAGLWLVVASVGTGDWRRKSRDSQDSLTKYFTNNLLSWCVAFFILH